MKNIFRFLFVLGFLFQSRAAHSQSVEKPSFKLYLIGDAGESDSVRATLHQLKAKLDSNANSAVIFLGDNCYTGALLGFLKFNVGGYDGSKLAQDRLMGQLNILRDYKGSAYFVPGNHDWFNKTNVKRGKKKLLAEQTFIEDTLKNFTKLKNHAKGTFLPANGSPGPVSLNFNNGKVRIIFIDTYRLIIAEKRLGKKKDTTLLNKFYRDLDAQLDEATLMRQKIIVVAHHPILAKGHHSLPLSFSQGIVRRFADANTNYPPYHDMAVQLDSLLKSHHRPDIYYVAGHEHSLEYFYTDSLHYIVSGAGCKTDNVLQKPEDTDAEFQIWKEQGFFEIDFYSDGEALILYYSDGTDPEMKIRHCVNGCRRYD